MSTHRLYIDPGFTFLGWAMFKGDKPEDHGTTGVSRNPNEPWLNYFNRGLLHFGDWFSDLKATYDIEEVVFENINPAVSNSPQMPLVFGAVAVIKTLAYRDDIGIRDMSALTWKKALHGHTKKITKVMTRNAVLDLFPEVQRDRRLTAIKADETDALAIGIADRRMNGSSEA